MTGPRRPGDVDWRTSLADVLESYQDHARRLVDARYGLGEPLAADRLAGHALAAVATQHAIADRVLAGRWVNVRDALVFGASLAEVAAAMAVTSEEAAAGLRRWADGQVEHCGMTAAEHDEVLALLGQAVR